MFNDEENVNVGSDATSTDTTPAESTDSVDTNTDDTTPSDVEPDSVDAEADATAPVEEPQVTEPNPANQDENREFDAACSNCGDSGKECIVCGAGRGKVEEPQE